MLSYLYLKQRQFKGVNRHSQNITEGQSYQRVALNISADSDLSLKHVCRRHCMAIAESTSRSIDRAKSTERWSSTLDCNINNRCRWWRSHRSFCCMYDVLSHDVDDFCCCQVLLLILRSALLWCCLLLTRRSDNPAGTDATAVSSAAATLQQSVTISTCSENASYCVRIHPANERSLTRFCRRNSAPTPTADSRYTRGITFRLKK